MVPLFRLPVLFALAAGARRRAFVDAGCRCQPARALRPNCPVGKLPADIDYRRAAGALPLAMCIGDSVSGPSCRAAAAGLADRLELRSVEFPPMLTRTPRPVRAGHARQPPACCTYGPRVPASGVPYAPCTVAPQVPARLWRESAAQRDDLRQRAQVHGLVDGQRAVVHNLLLEQTQT